MAVFVQKLIDELLWMSTWMETNPYPISL